VAEFLNGKRLLKHCRIIQMGYQTSKIKKSRQKSIKEARKYGEADIYYNLKFRWSYSCVYCGEPADQKDHVFPLSRAARLDLSDQQIRKILGQGLRIVPCCGECNRIAGDEGFFSIREKRDFIQKRLRKKYEKFLRHVIWDDDEMQELGRNMRDAVLQAMKKRYILELRVTYPQSRTIVKNSFTNSLA
jgi:hypothetical protein